MTLKKKKKSDTFCRKFLGKCLGIIFKNFQLEFLDLGQKTNDFTRF